MLMQRLTRVLGHAQLEIIERLSPAKAGLNQINLRFPSAEALGYSKTAHCPLLTAHCSLLPHIPT